MLPLVEIGATHQRGRLMPNLPIQLSKEDLSALSDLIYSFEGEDQVVYEELEHIKEKIDLHLEYLDHHDTN